MNRSTTSVAPVETTELERMARTSIDKLGTLQKAVMEAVWERGEATVQQVRDCMKRDPLPAYTTILSVMQKLEKAGWLTHRAEGRSYIYAPVRSREEAGATSLRNLHRTRLPRRSAALVPALAGGREPERPGPERLEEHD